MTSLSLGILSILWLGSASQTPDTEARAFPTGNTTTVRMESSKYDLIFAKVTVQGTEALALVDTGCSCSVWLSSELARQLELPLSRDANSALQWIDGKTTPVQTATLQVLKAGSLERRDVPIKFGGDRFETIARGRKPGFDVILGWAFLSENYFLVDYKNRFLQFSDAPFELKGSHMTWNYSDANKIPAVEARLDESEVSLYVDTGALTTRLDSARARASPGQVVAREVTIGGRGLTLQWLAADLSRLRVAGIIGNNFLSRFSLYFDTRNKRIHLYE